MKPKFQFAFDVSAAAFHLNPASSENILQFPRRHSLSSTLCLLLRLRCAQQVTGSFNVSIDEALVIVRRCLVNRTFFRSKNSSQKRSPRLLCVFHKSFSRSHTLFCSIEKVNQAQLISSNVPPLSWSLVRKRVDPCSGM